MGDNTERAHIAALLADSQAHGWTLHQTVQAIIDQLGVSPLKAHRLARGWTRPQAIQAVLATYTADGLVCPNLTTNRLCHWEHGRNNPSEDYLDRLCRAYHTRADVLGYGHDYTPDEPSQEPHPDYAGHHPEPDGEETAMDRRQFFHAAGATGMAALVEQTGLASMRLSRTLEESNVGPVTLDHLELQAASLLAAYSSEQMPSHQMLRRASRLHDEVATLLEGRQTLTQRWELYRIAGQLSALLGGASFDTGNYPVAYAHLRTAEQLAREVSDYGLLAWTRMTQSTVALWGKDFRTALSYAQDGQRYATGDLRARLAARCEARALARMNDRAGTMDALRRARKAVLASYQAGERRESAWSSWSPGGLAGSTAMSLLWLGQFKDAEPHAREAIAWYETAPATSQPPVSHTQAKIDLAICLAHQGHPNEGIRLATEALTADQGGTEANVQHAADFLAALQFRHHDLPATRDFADHLHTLRTPRP